MSGFSPTKSGIHITVVFVIAIIAFLIGGLLFGLIDNSEPDIPEREPSLAETEYGCEPGEVAYISSGPTECLSPEEVERRNAEN